MDNNKSTFTLKPRHLTEISGSIYVALPKDWLLHHNLGPRSTVNVSMDKSHRLIITPLTTQENE